MEKSQRYVVRSVSSAMAIESTFLFRDRHVLVIADRLGGIITQELVTKLEEASCKVAVVSSETKNYETNCKDGIERLGSVQIVINLCGLSEEKDFTCMSSEEWKQELTHVFCLTMTCLQAVYFEWKENPEECAYFNVSNMGADFGLGEEKSSNTAAGIVTGLAKAMAREVNGLFCKSIDFDETAETSQLVKCILDEMSNMSAELEISYTKAKNTSSYIRKNIEIFPEETTIKRDEKSFSEDDVFLFIGGGRGIISAFIEELIKNYPIKVVVVGRTTIPEDQDWVRLSDSQFKAYKTEYMRTMKQNNKDMSIIQIVHSYEQMENQRKLVKTLRHLKEISKKVYYINCDVSDINAVRKMEKEVRDQIGLITGVINGAGLLTVGNLGKKDISVGLDGILVRGLGIYNLYHVLKEHPLKFFQNVGSVAGRFGMDGQCDYVASCDLATKMCRHINRVQNKFLCCSMEWTAWEDIGMAALPEVRQVQESRGLRYISVKEGKQRFMEELLYGKEEEVLIFRELGNGIVNQYPFIDHVIYQDQKSMSVTRRLDINKDLYLRQHKVEGDYVFPAVAHIELYCEMIKMFAKQNKRKLYIKEIETVELQSFVKYFEKNELVLKGVIEIEENDVMTAWGSITSDFKNSKGMVLLKDRKHSNVKMILGEGNEDDRKEEVFPYELDIGKELDLEKFYQATDSYIHFGSLYKNVKYVKQISKQSFIGEIEAVGDSRLLTGFQRTSTASHPLVLDMVGRVALAGLFEEYHIIAVPVSLSHIKMYDKIREGERIFAYAQIIEVDEKEVKVRQKIVNAKKNVLYDLEINLYIIYKMNHK